MQTDTFNPTEEQRIAAYVAWAQIDAQDAEFLSSERYDETEIDGHRIMTDEEADEAVREYIRESLWAFNSSFLARYLPEGVGQEVVEMLQPQCEDANSAILSMVGDRFNELVADACTEDGRRHFLSSYDGEEHEFNHVGQTFYIFRTW